VPKFVLLVYEDEAAAPQPPSREWRALWDAYVALDEEAKAAGVLIDSQPFAATGTAVTVSLAGDRPQEAQGSASSGPPHLTGYYLVRCANQAEAVRWALKIPAAATGKVEVRPILEGPASL
jgi:hypothetical protein